ncbi:hypothetical protein HPP92_013696 [Vanilla planifolia]|uniref:CASP-like protein n=1 Tax=Vanilla planifolia TaxID=51239 RepID=A0A835QNX2_VANPL|nr:hypothetical protein HPP92_013696 [Vanilla planifolia]
MALVAMPSQSARSVRWVRIGRSTKTVLTLVAAFAMPGRDDVQLLVPQILRGWQRVASSFILSFVNKARSSLALIVGDLAATVVLFTSNAAAIAVVMVAWKGTPGFGWSRFCNVAGGFCGPVVAAIVISSIAAAVHFLLLSLSIGALHKRSSS